MTGAERHFDPRDLRAETWWPYLTIAARHAIMRHPDAALSRRVRQEVRQVTGVTLTRGVRLNEDDRRFVQLQAEVD